MTKKILPFMVFVLALAGCQTTYDEVIVEPDAQMDCVGANCEIVRYDSPNGNDLVLETDRHIIQIVANPGTKYSYQVWTGGKDTSTEPDLVVRDGNAMVLVEE
ncbi:MAG: hypothetical protein R8M37_01955 [Alphaproteobacteria bacterium]|nr:hypothetical protein [Alphaproteobacteria bacterium]